MATKLFDLFPSLLKPRADLFSNTLDFPSKGRDPLKGFILEAFGSLGGVTSNLCELRIDALDCFLGLGDEVILQGGKLARGRREECAKCFRNRRKLLHCSCSEVNDRLSGSTYRIHEDIALTNTVTKIGNPVGKTCDPLKDTSVPLWQQFNYLAKECAKCLANRSNKIADYTENGE